MTRILDASAVEKLLTPESVLAAMRQLFSYPDDEVGYGRTDLSHPKGWLRVLPAFIRPLGVFGFKTIHRTDAFGMRYAIYVHAIESGELAGIVDGLAITNLRTGAVSAVAADGMAPVVTDVAALVGTGPVARGQALLLDLVRPARELRVYARTPANRAQFVEEMAPQLSSRLVAAESLDEALDGAQLVTLATKATAPVFGRDQVVPGRHVNSVGPASRDRSEVTTDAFMAFDRVVCDSVGLVMDEAGDAHAAVGAGYDPATAYDLARVVSGEVTGRNSDTEATLFKSVGTGLQDLAVAARLIEAAEAVDAGVAIEPFMSVKAFGSG